jgi:hypothetical protein
MLPVACCGQQAQQFKGVPDVELTGGRVTSFLTGSFQVPGNGVDILYINAPALTPNTNGIPTEGILAGEDLNQNGSGLQDLGQNQIIFTGATNVVAAVGDFNADHFNDYAFAISGVTANNLCIYYGTGAGTAQGSISSYNAGSPANAYPPTLGGYSGCTTFSPIGNKPANFTTIAALPFTTGGLPQLLVEDSANNELYVFSNLGATGITLPGITLLMSVPLAATGGAGPIYLGDFNDDGDTDFIINGQTNHNATVFQGNGNGGFTPSQPYTFASGVYSMLMQNMDGVKDTKGKLIQDMVVEGSSGAIQIFPGKGDGTFATTSEGGTGSGDPHTGDGGQLAAIDPTTLNILTTTPIGLSVLTAPSGTLNYTLQGIYNIGPGRSSYALAQIFNTTQYLDFAVDSPEGIAIVQGDGNGDGGFSTSQAYSALAPALGATVGQYRNLAHNASGCLDVAVATGATVSNAVQGQLLTSNASCNGTFNTFNGITNTSAGPSGVQAGLWSNILSGDFNGDGVTDLAYSLTGYPLPVPGTTSVPGLFVQFGNGDGTFQAPVAMSVGAPNSNSFYGESTVGDFNGDGISDLANIDLLYQDTLLGQKSGSFALGLNHQSTTNQNFNVVAAGHFSAGASNKPADLLVQSGPSLIPYVNSGDGIHFNPMPAITWPLQAGTILLTDVNGDGKADIVALSYNTAANPQNPVTTAPDVLMIFYGNGDGTFGQPVTTSTPNVLINLSRNFYMAAVADMNGDTLPDLVLSDGYVVGILYNQGGGSFVSDWAKCGATGKAPCDEEHFLAGQGINSVSVQSVRGGTRPDIVVANGGATISNPIVLLGNTPQTSLSLTPNPVVNTGGITVLLNNITSLPTTGTLVAAPEPSSYGATFTITATLTSTANIAPTGLVAFYFDGTLLGSEALTAMGATTSSATYTVAAGNTYGGGTHTLTATYGGDANNSQNNTLSGTHTIKNATTTTTLDLCIGPSLACPSTGTVTPTPMYVANLSMIYGQTYNGIEEVTAAIPNTLLGNLIFSDLYNGISSVLCTLSPLSTTPCPVNVGTGTPVGVNVLTAAYVPGTADTVNAGSTSAPVTITVTPDTPVVTVLGSPNPSPQGQAVTLTATLAGPYAPLGTATSPVGLYIPPLGPVVFMNGSTVLCTSPLVVGGSGVNSTATCTTSALPVGTDTITASYAATLDFNAASGSTTETISALIPPSFTISVTPSPVSAGVGNAVDLTVTVTGQDGFAEGVNLSCGNLPNEANCFFAQAAIASGGGSSPLLVETSAPHNCGDSSPYFVGGNGGGPGVAPLALPALAGLVALFLPGRRRWLRALLAAVLLAGATQIVGCGNCTDLGTKPGTYTFQVIGTSTGTGQVQSQTVTLTITI